jgi:hypothetical protein
MSPGHLAQFTKVKVFWSWQSDTPGEIGHYFVRDVVKAAIKELKQALDFEEAEREIVSDLHIDHDRQGIPGSPDLARVIFEKIAAATVFIADVTPIGAVLSNAATNSKKLINSNVAIELGYALHSISDRALLMVMNAHFGTRADLPFDLQSKAGPLIFTLAPDASKESIKAEAARLKAQFVAQLRLLIGQRAKAPQVTASFIEAKATANDAIYFDPSEVLARGQTTGEPYYLRSHQLVYLRLFSANAIDPPIGLAKMSDLFQSQAIAPMALGKGGLLFRNRFGPISFDPTARDSSNSASLAGGLTQGFDTGELWGINGSIFVPQNPNGLDPRLKEPRLTIPILKLERLYVDTLRSYVKFAQSDLVLPAPYTVELGAIGLTGTYFTFPLANQRQVPHGPIMKDSCLKRQTLNAVSDQAMKVILRVFFMELYDLATISRPAILTDEFVTANDLPPR